MIDNDLVQPIKLNGCESCRGVVYRETNGKLAYLSFINNRRYGVNGLGFEGSEREFMRSCIECPPDISESYTGVTRTWKPSFCKNYVGSDEFRDVVAERCRLEDQKEKERRLKNLISEMEKDIA